MFNGNRLRSFRQNEIHALVAQGNISSDYDLPVFMSRNALRATLKRRIVPFCEASVAKKSPLAVL